MQEFNFDGIPGPTHNYSGLAQGNLASERNKSQVAQPREAALQGLAKMRALAQRGIPQAVLPPHERPAMDALRTLGFTGSDADILARVARDAPSLLAACSSAAAMWVANAATVSASRDTPDGRVHFTPANLATHFHRALEAPTTTAVLRAVFADETRFVVHDALPSTPQTGDEGAANHTRVATADGTGVDFFVYGRRAYGPGPLPARFPARPGHRKLRRRPSVDDAVAGQSGGGRVRRGHASSRGNAVDVRVAGRGVVGDGATARHR